MSRDRSRFATPTGISAARQRRRIGIVADVVIGKHSQHALLLFDIQLLLRNLHPRLGRHRTSFVAAPIGSAMVCASKSSPACNTPEIDCVANPCEETVSCECSRRQVCKAKAPLLSVSVVAVCGSRFRSSHSVRALLRTLRRRCSSPPRAGWPLSEEPTRDRALAATCSPCAEAHTAARGQRRKNQHSRQKSEARKTAPSANVPKMQSDCPQFRSPNRSCGMEASREKC